MNRTIKIIITVFFLISGMGNVLNAQTVGDDVFIKKYSVIKEVNNTDKKGFQPKVNVSLGSSFSTFYPGYNAFGTYIMPTLTMPVNKKVSVRAGIGYSTFFTGQKSDNSLFNNKPQSYGTVYVEGVYKVSEKVTISATGYKTFDLNPAPQKEKLNPHALDLGNEGVYFNMKYKINDHMEINAGFSYDKRNYNPYYTPFGGGGFAPGMYHGGFHNPAFGGFSPF